MYSIIHLAASYKTQLSFEMLNVNVKYLRNKKINIYKLAVYIQLFVD